MSAIVNPVTKNLAPPPPSQIPNWQVRSFEDAMKCGEQKPPWVIEDLLTAQSATLVSAQPHAMKSLSWLQACIEAVKKKKVWGHFDAPQVKGALFIETEDPLWLVEARVRGLAKGLCLGEKELLPGFHYVCPGPFEMVKFEAFLKQQLEIYNPDFVVISTLQNTLGNRSMKEQDDMAPVMGAVIRLSRTCPIVLITHSPWDKRQRRAAGTVTQAANFLTTMHYEKVSNKKTGETFVQIEVDSKAGALENSFHLKLTTAGDPRDPGSVRSITYAGLGWPKGVGKAAVLAAIEDDPDASPKEIAERCGVTARYVQQIIQKSRVGERNPKLGKRQQTAFGKMLDEQRVRAG